MTKIKAMIKEHPFLGYSFFIAFNAALLYSLYFIIKNFHTLASTVTSTVGSLMSALAPLFIGLVLAYLLSPLVDLIDKRIMSRFFYKEPEDPLRLEKWMSRRRFISVLLTFLLLLIAVCAILYAFSVLILGQFVFSGIAHMTDTIIEYFSSYREALLNWVESLPAVSGLADEMRDMFDSLITWFYEHFDATAIADFLTGLSGSLVNLALGVIVSIYLLKDKHFFRGVFRKLLHLILPQKANAMVTEVLSEINSVFSKFIRGALLDSLIIAILSSIGLSLMGLDFAVFIGCFAGLANVIPYFGPVLGMIPAFLVGTFTQGILYGLLAVGILLIIQQIDCNIIYPKIVGATTGLHPLFVLLSVAVAGYYGGILGMILAVPLAGIVQVFVVKWAKSKQG